MDIRCREYVDALEKDQKLEFAQWKELIESYDKECMQYAAQKAVVQAEKIFGKKIFVRGLIEISNYCKNNCYYCGIRRSNSLVERYRLKKEEILLCCQKGWELGYRTFVLQGGEDMVFSQEWYEGVVSEIKKRFPECAITLSIGERSRESYESLFRAGADRYLLRHETADEAHYAKLHPSEQTLSSRMQCLSDLKEIGYQVGCGFMVGSPEQSSTCLAEDMCFIQKFRPHMVGIGPFIPAKNTPFSEKKAGDIDLTLFLLSLLRLMNPNVLLPATTALGTLCEEGRERGILSGANVIMPNLSPANVRGKYILYDKKICTGDEAAEMKKNLEKRMEAIGYQIVTDRGDFPGMEAKRS